MSEQKSMKEIAEEMDLLFRKYVSAYSQKDVDTCIDKIIALFPDIEEVKREIVSKLYGIEFESNSATDFLNKTMDYLKTLKGD